MLESAIDFLLKNQNADGGWGSVRGKGSNTESTSLSVLALKSANRDLLEKSIERGIHWLVERQRVDGSWSLNDTSRVPSWSTAMAILALGLWPEYQNRTIKAANWVLQQEGNRPGLLAKVLFALSFKKKAALNLNLDLVGWPWSSGTFSWVEPTSYYLIALKKLRSQLAGTNVDDRIKQADLMIYDRMCRGGGWNYGNSEVLDENLWPYPDITAVALIALQDHGETDANKESLRALEGMLKDVHSGLALSWSVICLSLYGQDTGKWRNLLAETFEKTRFLGETKSVALAALALSDGAKFFRV
jgi:hypothetical protein